MVTVNSNDELLKKCSYVAISSYRRKVLETLKNDVKIPSYTVTKADTFKKLILAFNGGDLNEIH